MLAIGCARTERAFGFHTNVMAAHQPGYALLAAGDLLTSQLPRNPWTAISLAALVKDQADLLQKLLVGLSAWSRNFAPPLIVATASHFQDPAQAADWVLGRQGADHGISFCDCFEESMPRDFFRISRSCRTVSSSFFNRAFSNLST